MLIYNNKFAVSPITTHIDIKDISKEIEKKNIIEKISTINKWYKRISKKNPKIGILGLNPHNAEYRSGSEENLTIIPAIKSMKKNKINITGPLVADTIFIKDYKKYDVIIGMFHDQVLIPLKQSINLMQLILLLVLNI